MKEFQIIVSAPPSEVLRRLSSVMSPPYSFEDGWGKDFTGRIEGHRFNFRVTQRFGRNFFAPACSGAVEPHGSGSAVRFSVGSRGGPVKVIPLAIGLILGLGVVLLGAFGAIVRLAFPAGDFSPGDVVWVLFALVVPMTMLTGFFASLFLLGRWRGKVHERRLTELLPSLLRDVTIPPPRA